PGHLVTWSPFQGAAGNFVVSRVRAAVTPPGAKRPAGRYVRVELPGKDKALALAEVQVYSGTDNVARLGEARQSSTYFDSPARLAVDGNTDGDFFNVKSVAHTTVSDSPWWEVNLKAPYPIDRITVWNRTDGGRGKKLVNFRVVVLNEKREPVWEQ